MGYDLNLNAHNLKFCTVLIYCQTENGMSSMSTEYGKKEKEEKEEEKEKEKSL